MATSLRISHDAGHGGEESVGSAERDNEFARLAGAHADEAAWVVAREDGDGCALSKAVFLDKVIGDLSS